MKETTKNELIFQKNASAIKRMETTKRGLTHILRNLSIRTFQLLPLCLGALHLLKVFLERFFH